MQQHQTPLDTVSQIDHDIYKLNSNLITDTVLFGNSKYSVSVNAEISITYISYIFSRWLECLARCCARFLFAVSCGIGALVR